MVTLFHFSESEKQVIETALGPVQGFVDIGQTENFSFLVAIDFYKKEYADEKIDKKPNISRLVEILRFT